jgi:hypothetical protein
MVPLLRNLLWYAVLYGSYYVSDPGNGAREWELNIVLLQPDTQKLINKIFV